jgi:PEP-CTERM motif
MKTLLSACLVCAVLVAASAGAETISVGPYVPSTSTPFIVPIEISGAVDLQSFAFDLNYDASVLSINAACDPFSDASCDFVTGPVTLGTFYTDAASFPPLFNPGFITLDASGDQTGQLVGINGAWQDFDPAPSGDGVLVFVEFLALADITEPAPITVVGGGGDTGGGGTSDVPEPASLLLLGGGALVGWTRRRATTGRAAR